MSAAAKKLVVCGGNGFLGSRICKYAVARGWDVTSISRSGEPRWENVTSSPSPPSWSHQVSWERGDILRPSTYAPLLKGANYVVHSMGILIEADYKGLVSGKESPITGLQKVFASTRDRGIKPLQAKYGEDIKPANANDQFSYEVMNRDSAVALAKHAAEEKVGAFCYISAAGGAPVLPQRYISTKREAEAIVTSSFPDMRGLFIRAPFMYDSSRKFTLAMAAAAGGGAIFNQLTGKYFQNLIGAGGAKPLKVDTVAEAVVEALSDEDIKGPVEVPEIEDLSAKAWRKTML
ncbi:unnamed protein product [Clonostachys rosea f. rosea IK726]|uniref:NAD-dependent epimerase/dehydratase domain-containing protein n=3 Tax=Clonostachys TaxID=110564 RepID=A0A0B7JKK4_BIOOC|nr:unnamed protein product [Clonostachys rosea f. rosea IK726]CAI6088804.1 unnamed protein product [Clonostachys chloroleuca]